MAINLDPNYRSGFSRKQGIEARRKMELILSVLSDKPLTAVEISAITKLAEPTVRHHLHTMEKRKQVIGKKMYKIFGDQTKRYVDVNTDMTNLSFERQHRCKFIERNEKICEFLHNTVKSKQEIADKFQTKFKTMDGILSDLLAEGKIKHILVKPYPWRAASKYFTTSWSEDNLVAESKYLVEKKYIHHTKKSFEELNETVEFDIELPDLPPNLLAMMGYTSVKPPEGKQYNVDEYSASHPDWNKFQGRKGIAYSNIGCSMQMMIESAPGAI